MKNSAKIKGENKVKIAFISHASDLYGAPRSLLLLLEKIDLEKYNPFVICPNNGPLVDRISALGIPTYIMSRDPFFAKRIKNAISVKRKNGVPQVILTRLKRAAKYAFKAIYILKLLLFLYKIEPDLVYINTIAHASPIIAAKIMRIPILVHVRESRTYLAYNSVLGKLRLFTILNFPNRFICVSEATKKLLVEKGVLSQKITVVYNGVDLDEFKPSKEMRQRKRNEIRLSNETVLVGFIGQLIPRKGIENFIEAASIVHKQSENCKFIIIGGPTDSYFFKSKILSLYHMYKLEDYLFFVGFKEDVRNYFSAIDIFTNTSKEEPFARVNLEAMAMGKPVIATNTGGNPEAIVTGKTGYIVPVGDSQSLAERILELANNRYLRESFGRAARKRVEKLFTVDHYYQSIEAILDCLIKQRCMRNV